MSGSFIAFSSSHAAWRLCQSVRVLVPCRLSQEWEPDVVAVGGDRRVPPVVAVAAGHGADGPAVLVDHRVDGPLLLVQAVVVRGQAEPVQELAGPVEEDGLLGDGRPEPALDGRRGVDVRLGHADQRELALPSPTTWAASPIRVMPGIFSPDSLVSTSGSSW
jgi:hypothetical protein